MDHDSIYICKNNKMTINSSIKESTRASNKKLRSIKSEMSSSYDLVLELKMLRKQFSTLGEIDEELMDRLTSLVHSAADVCDELSKMSYKNENLLSQNECLILELSKLTTHYLQSNDYESLGQVTQFKSSTASLQKHIMNLKSKQKEIEVFLESLKNRIYALESTSEDNTNMKSDRSYTSLRLKLDSRINRDLYEEKRSKLILEEFVKENIELKLKLTGMEDKYLEKISELESSLRHKKCNIKNLEQSLKTLADEANSQLTLINSNISEINLTALNSIMQSKEQSHSASFSGLQSTVVNQTSRNKPAINTQLSSMTHLNSSFMQSKNSKTADNQFIPIDFDKNKLIIQLEDKISNLEAELELRHQEKLSLESLLENTITSVKENSKRKADKYKSIIKKVRLEN